MLKKLRSVLTLLLVMGVTSVFGQAVGINNATPAASAILDIVATNKGVLIPRMTTAQRLAIPTPSKGLLVFDNSTGENKFYFYDGTTWVAMAAFAGTPWLITGNSGTTAISNFLGTIDSIDMVIKTNNTTRMKVSANGGNVGIGNITPSVKLDVDGALALRNTLSATTISSDNFIVTVGNRSYIQVSSNTTDFNNRDFSLTQGSTPGQILVIEFIGSNYARMTNGSTVSGGTGFLKLAGDRVFGSNSTISLIWNGIDWIETSSNINSAGGSKVFYSTGANQSFIVPPGVNKIKVKMWGAGGGAGDDIDAKGGAGAYISADVAVVPNSTLTLVVGSGGASNNGITSYSYGGGGSNGFCNGPGYSSGAGGGRSALIFSGIEVLTAGGGGGGGSSVEGLAGSAGGNAVSFSALPSGNGVSTGGSTGGLSATSTVAGNGGIAGSGGLCGVPVNGQIGLAQLGAPGISRCTSTGNAGSGGGGGGYFGGGSGSSNGGAGCTGGGGGSSYFSPTQSFNVSTSVGSGNLAADTSNPDYPGNNIGEGGNANHKNGFNGYIMITW
jgi:hypothetical protein